MKKLICTGIAGLLAAGTVHAAFGWKDGPHVGYTVGGDVRNEDFAYGWQVAYEFNEYFSLEGSITKQTDEIEEYIGELSLPSIFRYDLDVWALALTFRAAAIPHERVRVYGGAGFGYYIFKSDSNEAREVLATRPADAPLPIQLIELSVDVDNDFGVHAAAGIEIELARNWEFFAEYRYISLEPDAELSFVEQFPPPDESAPFLRTTTILPDTLEYNHGLVRTGISYRF